MEVVIGMLHKSWRYSCVVSKLSYLRRYIKSIRKVESSQLKSIGNSNDNFIGIYFVNFNKPRFVILREFRIRLGPGRSVPPGPIRVTFTFASNVSVKTIHRHSRNSLIFSGTGHWPRCSLWRFKRIILVCFTPSRRKRLSIALDVRSIFIIDPMKRHSWIFFQILVRYIRIHNWEM